jgi:small subunit ribosomal protein S6
MSKIKHYETMFILKPTLTEEETVAQIDGIRAIIEKNGGEIVSFDNVGKRISL